MAKVKSVKRPGKISMVLSDQHIPFMDDYASDLTLEVAKVIQPDQLIFNGDLVDFWQISTHCNNPMQRITTISEDAYRVFCYLRDWHNLCPNAELIVLGGNHEHRLRIWREKHKELADFNALEDVEFFKFDLAGVDKYIPYMPEDWQSTTNTDHDFWIIKNKLMVMHGYRFSEAAGYVCNHMLKDCGCAGISSHNHKIGMSNRRLKLDPLAAWWEIGCLAKLNPTYKVHANWQLGFGIVSIWPNGSTYDVYPVRILPDYRCEVLGTKFTRKGPL